VHILVGDGVEVDEVLFAAFVFSDFANAFAAVVLPLLVLSPTTHSTGKSIT